MADKRVTELTEKTTVNANDYLIVDNATDGTKKIKVSAISDSALSDSSENPVQNKVVKAALDSKQGTLTAGSNITITEENVISATGGGGGSTDYPDLTNKPQINSVTLVGNKSLADLGAQGQLTFDATPTENSDNPVKSGGVYSALAGKQATLTFDNAPTESSDNPVKSGGIYSALAGKQATLTFDNVPTANSTNPVTSDGIKTALDAKQGTLTAGSNITINNNVISASVSVSANEYTKTVNLAYSDSKTIALDMTGYSYAATDSIDVYINGLHGILGTDYTVSVSGTSASVVLTLAGTTGTTENIEIIATKYS